jgi:hypothetical protein
MNFKKRGLSKKFNRVIALVGDMHTLSRFGLLPDGSFNSDGKDLAKLRNNGQEIIWQAWKMFCDVCDKWQVDTVINLADACSGINWAEGGRDTYDTSLEVQMDAAVTALEPLVKDRMYHGISGSPYHQSRDCQIHRTIAKRMQSECGAVESRFHGIVANLELLNTNRTMNVAHKATNAQIYRTMILDRESLFMRLAEAELKLPHFDYIVRGHLHNYFHLDISDQHVIQCPCWQAYYAIKGSTRLYGRMQPDIGGVILFIDNKDRTTLHHYLLKDFGLEQPHILDFVKKG